MTTNATVTGHVEVDPKLAPVVIGGRVLNEIYAHARESQPEECCGLLTGEREGHFLKAHRCNNVMTLRHSADPIAYPRGGRHAFHMEEQDYLEVLREAEAAGLMVTGVYHSHVDAGVYFSIDDQEFALHELYPFPKADHIVVSVVNRVVKDVAAFRWVPRAGCFEGRRLLVESP